MLRAIDISVPGRASGRMTEQGKKQREKWVMCRLLSSLGATDDLLFPLSVEHADKPDFLIKLENDEVGVEATECTDERYSEYLTLASQEFPGAILDIGLFLPSRPTPSFDEMRQQLRERKLVSNGWGCLEEPWAKAIHRTIQNKTEKLTKGTIRSYSENWLSIYSNTPFDDIRIRDAAQLLYERLDNYWTRSSCFKNIFIERGRTIIALSADGWRQMSLHDLWSPPVPVSDAIDASEENLSDKELWSEIMRQPSPTKRQRKL
jgi:hypothetical protein